MESKNWSKRMKKFLVTQPWTIVVWAHDEEEAENKAGAIPIEKWEPGSYEQTLEWGK
jgi:hypothetical protein